MLGRLHHVVLDCPDPAARARFYSRHLGQPITYQSKDWVVIAADDQTSDLAFQVVPDHRRPRGRTRPCPSSSTWTSWSKTSRRPSPQCWALRARNTRARMSTPTRLATPSAYLATEAGATDLRQPLSAQTAATSAQIVHSRAALTAFAMYPENVPIGGYFACLGCVVECQSVTVLMRRAGWHRDGGGWKGIRSRPW
jgi:hypothetical protein